MTTFQRQPSYHGVLPSPQQAPYNTFNPNMPPGPTRSHSDYPHPPVRTRSRGYSNSSQHSQLSAPFLQSGTPGVPGTPNSVQAPPNQLAVVGRQNSQSSMSLRPSSAASYHNSQALQHAGMPMQSPMQPPMQPNTSAPPLMPRNSYESHRSYHSYRGHHDLPENIDEESPERERSPMRPRPTVGDSMMMIVDSVRGLFSSRR